MVSLNGANNKADRQVVLPLFSKISLEKGPSAVQTISTKASDSDIVASLCCKIALYSLPL